MWTFWYHEPDENKIFNNCNYIRMFDVESVDQIPLVLKYFRDYSWLRKGIFSITQYNVSPKMEDHLNDTTISCIAFWEHRKTHEQLCIDAFEILVNHFCNETMLTLNPKQVLCVRSTPKPNERCAFNIWIHDYPIQISDCRNIMCSKFKTAIQTKIYRVKTKNDSAATSPFQVKKLDKKFTKTANQFSMILNNCPPLQSSG